jgi:hypothetical protein
MHNDEESRGLILLKIPATLVVILGVMVIWIPGFVEPCCNTIIETMLVSLDKRKLGYLMVV